MKKLFTFLLAMTTITTLFAQSYTKDNRGRDSKNGSTSFYQDRNKGNDKNYQQSQQDWNKSQQDWNRNQQDWNKNDRGRDDHKNFGDRKMQESRGYNRNYDMNSRNGRYETPQRKSNAGGIVAGVIIGGILGALLSH